MKQAKKVVLVSHIEKKEALAFGEEVIDWLKKRGVEIRLPEEDAKAYRREDLGISYEELFDDEVDFVLTLGGDGTILRAARLISKRDIPILGVNLGRFGFLSEVEVKNLYPSLEKALRKDFEIEKRKTLSCRLIKNGEEKAVATALNEVVVERGTLPKLLNLDVYINDLFFLRYTCDGLIFATPTGSTAYSFSAGGPVVNPSAEVILITPICPHLLFDRTVVLKDSDQIKVSFSEPKSFKGVVSVDGVIAGDLASGEWVEIKTSDSPISLMRLAKRNFYDDLREKLRLGGS